MFGVEPKLLQQLAAALGLALLARSFGPAIVTTAVLKEQPTFVAKDQDGLRVIAVGNIANHLTASHFGNGIHGALFRWWSFDSVTARSDDSL